ncbi:MAG: DUF1727 domain-containing protein [Clostridia bacterium]|nr:DUF1727 domain-containing protein [Clostridia bacterium]
MFRFIIAFLVGKAAKLVLRLFGRRATHFPGSLALDICPDFLRYIGKPKNIICVTGTNGKTSTCNMIADSLRQDGLKVLDNSYGSNILHGICATFIDGVNIFNKPVFENCVLEVDERSSLHVYKYVTPTYFICTNLFRDSVMRNAHTEFIFSMINDYLPASTKLILNGDDVISSRLGEGVNESRTFFSVDRLEGEQTEEYNIINDGRACPVCGAKMIFDFKRYHHIGKAHCSRCDVKSPDADYTVVSADEKAGTITLSLKGEEYTFPMINEAVFNIYNEAAVIALLSECGYSPEKIAGFMGNLHITSTRYTETESGGVRIISTMLKGYNPIACSRNCHIARIHEGKKALFFNVDDVYNEKDDSEVITWHYEADFEALNDESITQIYAVGPRSLDIKYRLLLAGIPEEKIIIGRYPADVIEKMEHGKFDTLILFYDMVRYDDMENDIKPAIVKKLAKEDN